MFRLLNFVLFTQNEKAFSLNAIVDVCRRHLCRRHHEIIFNILEAPKAINCKIYHNVALYSLYISTGNDVIINFQSAANSINVFIFVMFGSRFLDNGSTVFENV